MERKYGKNAINHELDREGQVFTFITESKPFKSSKINFKRLSQMHE